MEPVPRVHDPSFIHFSHSSRVTLMSDKESLCMFLFFMAICFVSCGTLDLVEESSYKKLSSHSEDSLITSRLKANLLRDTALGRQTIQLETTNGIVHLHGIVNNRIEAQRAEKIASEIPGVVAVENNLRVRLTN